VLKNYKKTGARLVYIAHKPRQINERMRKQSRISREANPDGTDTIRKIRLLKLQLGLHVF